MEDECSATITRAEFSRTTITVDNAFGLDSEVRSSKWATPAHVWSIDATSQER